MDNWLFSMRTDRHLFAVKSACSFFILLAGTVSLSAADPGSEKQVASVSDLSSFSQQIPVRGVIRSSKRSAISSNVVAKVEAVRFLEGEEFFKDDLLIQLDCRRLQAEWDAAEAYRREMELGVESAQYLVRNSAGSPFKVQTAKARLDKAKADLSALTYNLEQCEIRAPFHGLVTNVAIQEHEMTAVGKPLMSIVSNNDPTLEMIVPSNWINWIEVGRVFQFHVDETKRTLPCTVTRVSASIDSVSQTVKIFARFNVRPRDILPGMSGTAKFD